MTLCVTCLEQWRSSSSKSATAVTLWNTFCVEWINTLWILGCMLSILSHKNTMPTFFFSPFCSFHLFEASIAFPSKAFRLRVGSSASTCAISPESATCLRLGLWALWLLDDCSNHRSATKRSLLSVQDFIHRGPSNMTSCVFSVFVGFSCEWQAKSTKVLLKALSEDPKVDLGPQANPSSELWREMQLWSFTS